MQVKTKSTRLSKANNGVTKNTVTINQLAELLQVHYETARKYISQDLFTAITPCGGRRSGATILIPRDEVDAYLEGGKEALTRVRKAKRQKY